VIVGASGERKQKKHDCEALKSINNGYKKGVILYNDALDLLENVRKSELEKLKLQLGYSSGNPSNSTNKSIINRYLAEEYSKRKSLKDRTKEQIKYEFHAVLKILGPDVSLLKDDRDTIYYQILGNTHYSSESKSRLVCRFNALLKFLNRPFTIPKIHIQKSAKIPHITEEELKTFLNALGRDEDKVAARIIFYTGLRSGELFGLEGNDVDYTDRVITVERQLTRDLLVQKPKNNKERDVVFPAKVTKDIKKWCVLPDSYKRENVATFSRRFLKASRKVWGIDKTKDISAHDIRRSFAIHMLGRGFSITEISFLLGDSEKVVRMYYAGYSANKELLNRMRERLG